MTSIDLPTLSQMTLIDLPTLSSVLTISRSYGATLSQICEEIVRIPKADFNPNM